MKILVILSSLTVKTLWVWCSESKSCQECKEGAVEEQVCKVDKLCHSPLPPEQSSHKRVLQQLEILTLSLMQKL